MAAGKSILKLVVDDKEYGSKLKNAQNALNALETVLQNTGKSFAQVDKAVVDYAKSIGQMSTQATSARGKIGEMTSTFTELSLKYRQLTEEEKKSPFGQALSASLDQLRTRTINAKRELEDLNKELNTTQAPKGGGGGLFSGDKMSGMLQVLGGNLMTKGITMAASALSNLTSEISECVTQGIELAKQGEGIRNAFERLGRGDLLAGLREATHGTVTDLELMKAAVKFDDFKLNLDELGTMLAFAQQKAKDTGQSVDYMVDSIVTGLGRKSLMILDNLGLSASDIKERMKETGDMTKAVGAIIREQMAKSGEYVETAADRAAQADVNLKNAMEDLGRTFQPLSDSANNMWTSIKIGALDLLNNAVRPLIDAFTEAGRARKAFEGMGGNDEVSKRLSALKGSNYKNYRYNAALRMYDRDISSYSQYLNDYKTWERDNTSIGAYDRMVAFRKRTGLTEYSDVKASLDAIKKMRAEYVQGAASILNPVVNTPPASGGATGGGGGKGGGKTTKQEIDAVTGSIDAQAKKVQELQKAWRAAATDSAREDYKKQIEEAQFALDIMMGKTSGIPAMNYGVGDLAGKNGSGLFQEPLFQQEKFDKKNPWQLDEKAIKAVSEYYDRKTNETTANLTKEVGNIAGGISGILGGIESLGIDLPDGMKDVVSGIQGVIGILTSISTIVTAIQTIAAADTLIPFARGGIAHAANGFVPGNRYSADDIPVAVSSGELILNRAQQGALASQLQNNQQRGPELARVSGEQIYVAMSNYLRRSGKGELITWR